MYEKKQQESEWESVWCLIKRTKCRHTYCFFFDCVPLVGWTKVHLWLEAFQFGCLSCFFVYSTTEHSLICWKYILLINNQLVSIIFLLVPCCCCYCCCLIIPGIWILIWNFIKIIIRRQMYRQMKGKQNNNKNNQFNSANVALLVTNIWFKFVFS